MHEVFPVTILLAEDDEDGEVVAGGAGHVEDCFRETNESRFGGKGVCEFDEGGVFF